MFKKLSFCILFLSFFLLTACGTVSHIPLSSENARLTKSIYIDSQIKKPKDAYAFASGAEYGMAFGAIGGILAGEANAKTASSIQTLAEDHQINIQKIVYQQMQQQFANSRFKLARKPDDAILQLEIVQYGLSIPHGFSSDYVPVLSVNAKLSLQNQIIWQSNQHVLPMTSGMPRYKMDEILNDPTKLAFMWNKAAEKIAKDMVNDLNQVR